MFNLLSATQLLLLVYFLDWWQRYRMDHRMDQLGERLAQIHVAPLGEESRWPAREKMSSAKVDDKSAKLPHSYATVTIAI